MTRDDAERYARDCQKYEYNKHHFYLFGHDNFTLLNYVKGGFLGVKLTVIVIICAIALIALLSAFGLVLGFTFMQGFMFWTAFVVIGGIITAVYNYFLYLNYVDDSEGYAPIFTAIVALGAAYYVSKFDTFVAIVCALLIEYISLRVTKSIYWDECNALPNVRDYDSEIDLEAEREKFARVKQQMKEEGLL